MKLIYLGVTAFFIIGLVGLGWYISNEQVTVPFTDSGEEILDGQNYETTDNKSDSGSSTIAKDIKTSKFSGLLEVVDTGCFSDGECFVVVGGKHITAIVGRRNEEVGDILNVTGFGDLEKYLGDTIDVYARDLGDNNFTLYGSANFYIKVSNGGGLTIPLGQTESFF
jgi:hypothetical protein